NKVWNAARFVLRSLDGAPQPIPRIERAHLGLAERWILSRLDACIGEVTGEIDAYHFNVAAMSLYQFIWHEFCDWYIELAKEPLKAGGERQAAARWVLVECFDKLLRLLHGFMPFLTEEIWQTMRPYIGEPQLAAHLPIAKYPEVSKVAWLSSEEAAAMDHCIEATEAINSLRALLGHHPGQKVRAVIRRSLSDFSKWASYAATLAKLDAISDQVPATGQVVFSHLAFADVGVEAPDGFDFEVARQKIRKQLDEVGKHAKQHRARLDDERFMAKADPETVTEVQQKFESLQGQQGLLSEQLKQLEAAQ
ncbi:MAG TPA: class I tRNA ligase family protein, partial [Candidatus Binataceae bacterium]|nr:class I tRNA ligase family protein [Candidatus Binataceae bacterium]